MEKSFWQKRISRRRLLGGVSSLAIVGSGARFLPRVSLPRPAMSHSDDFIIAEDIRHNASDLAWGQLTNLSWDESATEPVLRAASSSGGLLNSTVVKTSFPATHIGLHWTADADGPAPISFDVRTASDGSAWGDWQTVPIEAEPDDNPTGERFGTLVWARNARYVEYRANFPTDSTPDATALKNVTITAISASPSSTMQATRATRTPTPSSRSTPQAIRDAGELEPPFGSDRLITREQWGAPESYRFNSSGNEIWPRQYIPTKKIVVHHTATLTNSNPQDPSYPYPSYAADQAVQDIRAIYYYHAINLGWGDIGYNALIDRFGRIFEGRRGRDSGPGGGREIISPDVVAGHALNCNEGSAGVSCLGNYDENQIGSGEQLLLSTLAEVIAWWCRRHYIEPDESSDFLEVNWAWVMNLPNICGHRDVNFTACPGQYLYPYLPSIRNAVVSLVEDQAIIKPGVTLTSLPTQTDIDAGAATFSWNSSDSGVEYSYYLEGWNPNLATDKEDYVCGFTSDKRPDWSSWSSITSVTLKPSQAGHYTFHVRARNSKTDGAYEDNWTFVPKAKKQQRTPGPVGVPGVVRF
jgi:hypothetical protein